MLDGKGALGGDGRKEVTIEKGSTLRVGRPIDEPNADRLKMKGCDQVVRRGGDFGGEESLQNIQRRENVQMVRTDQKERLLVDVGGLFGTRGERRFFGVGKCVPGA